MNNHVQRIGEEKVSKLLFKFSIPAIISMLVSAMYNIIDAIFIGHSVGPLGIAAVTVAFPIMMIQMAFGLLVGVGTTTLVSIRLGEQKHDEAQSILGNGFALVLIIALIVSIAGLIFIEPLLQLFGASSDVMPYAKDFTTIILAGSFFMTTGFSLNSLISAEGKPTKAMILSVLGTLINLGLAPLFIFVLGWGIRGAALATVIAQSITAILIVSHFLRPNSYLKILLRNMKLKKELIINIMAIGSAPFLVQLAQCVLSAVMNQSLLAYGGDVAISGLGIIYRIMTLIFLPVLGISQGAQPIIGYNYGALQYQRVKRTLVLAISAATIISTVGFILTRAIPTQLIMLFNDDPQLVSFGTNAMAIFLFCLPILGVQVIGSNYFQAIGKPKHAMVLSLSRQVLILIPLLLILPKYLQLQGVLIAAPISDFLSTVITVIALVYEVRRLNQKENDLVRINTEEGNVLS
ncbi:MATE family efflux transporter [Dehalobacter sp. DCM]|uniref:MATE family efflux transporter n=1 Tax=Dehalobacter sp. DCM TaxID=2907827 RepID=UPI003081EDC2|nr:MATE family efflux transporter [Dehalobacter sp. DCM]